MRDLEFSRFTATAGFKEVGAVVQPDLLGVSPDSGSPLAVLHEDAAKGFGSVGRVVLGVGGAKIRPAIVGRIGIFMINHFGRLFACHQEPGNTMALKNPTLVLDSPIAFFASAASNAANYGAAMSFGLPDKIARFGAVFDRVLDRYRYFNHAQIIQGGSR